MFFGNLNLSNYFRHQNGGMKVVFEDDALAYIYVEGKEKGKPKFPPEIIRGFIKKIQIILGLNSTAELRKMKGLRFEALQGNYAGFHSIRINNQYRIILKLQNETDGSVTIEVLHIFEITDYH